GDVTDVGLEIFDFVKNGRVVKDPLLIAVMRTKSCVEWNAFAGSGVELPNHAIGQAFEMATAAGLPTLARKTVTQRVGSGNRIEVATRREKHFRANQVRFALGACSR